VVVHVSSPPGVKTRFRGMSSLDSIQPLKDCTWVRIRTIFQGREKGGKAKERGRKGKVHLTNCNMTHEEIESYKRGSKRFSGSAALQ